MFPAQDRLHIGHKREPSPFLPPLFLFSPPFQMPVGGAPAYSECCPAKGCLRSDAYAHHLHSNFCPLSPLPRDRVVGPTNFRYLELRKHMCTSVEEPMEDGRVQHLTNEDDKKTNAMTMALQTTTGEGAGALKCRNRQHCGGPTVPSGRWLPCCCLSGH